MTCQALFLPWVTGYPGHVPAVDEPGQAAGEPVPADDHDAGHFLGYTSHELIMITYGLSIPLLARNRAPSQRCVASSHRGDHQASATSTRPSVLLLPVVVSAESLAGR